MNAVASKYFFINENGHEMESEKKCQVSFFLVNSVLFGRELAWGNEAFHSCSPVSSVTSPFPTPFHSSEPVVSPCDY